MSARARVRELLMIIADPNTQCNERSFARAWSCADNKIRGRNIAIVLLAYSYVSSDSQEARVTSCADCKQDEPRFARVVPTERFASNEFPHDIFRLDYYTIIRGRTMSIFAVVSFRSLTHLIPREKGIHDATARRRTFVRSCFHYSLRCPRVRPAISFTPVRSGCTFSFLLLPRVPTLYRRQTGEHAHRSVMRIRSFTQGIPVPTFEMH